MWSLNKKPSAFERRVYCIWLRGPATISTCFSGPPHDAAYIHNPRPDLQLEVRSPRLATPYDWRRSWDLAVQLEGIENYAAAASSEGGLFAYGNDEEIMGNLEVLQRLTPPDFTISGSMCVATTSNQTQHPFISLAARSFDSDKFEEPVRKASWKIERQLAGPATHLLPFGQTLLNSFNLWLFNSKPA